MRTFVVTPPTDPAVTYDEAAVRLKLSDPDEQSDVEAMIAAATALIDGPGALLGIAVREQVIEVRLDAFAEEIELPYPPLIEIISVKYIDAAGSEQTVPSGDYYTAGNLLCVAPGAAWPVARTQREAVRIQYGAGHDPIPPDIKSGILFMVGVQYVNRDTAPDLSAEALKVMGKSVVFNR